MRILILTNNDIGLLKFRKELIDRLLYDQHEVLFSLPHGDSVPDLQALGCRYIQTEFDRRGKNPLKDIKLYLKYRAMIKETKPDTVLTYTVKPNVYGGIACARAGIPCIANVTGLGTAIENPGMLQKLTMGLYRMGLKKARRVFFQNQANLDLFRKLNIVDTNASLIPGSGVNLAYHQAQEYPAEDKDTSFLFIGRMMRDKGVGELLTAIEAVKRKKPDTRLHLVGGCDEGYQSKLAEAEKKGLITYHGHQPEVQSFIKTSHCTVLPSYHEGTANVLLESAANARPVIATTVPGCRETFDEGVTGLGCQPRDTQSLTDAMLRFIDLPWEQKRDMGLAGRKKMEREFDRNIVVDAYMQEIDKK